MNDNPLLVSELNFPTIRRQPFAELMQPRQLDHLFLPSGTIYSLKSMLVSGSIMNMVFYAKPGTGKSSAIRIMIEKRRGLDVDPLFSSNAVTFFDSGVILNEYESVKLIGPGLRFEDIDAHANQGMCPRYMCKLLCIAGADALSKDVQRKLASLVETRSDVCRFILEANNLGKLVPELKSHLQEVHFDVPGSDRDAVISRLLNRYAGLLSRLDIDFERPALAKIIATHFPDLQAIANHVEYEFGCW